MRQEATHEKLSVAIKQKAATQRMGVADVASVLGVKTNTLRTYFGRGADGKYPENLLPRIAQFLGLGENVDALRSRYVFEVGRPTALLDRNMDQKGQLMSLLAGNNARLLTALRTSEFTLGDLCEMTANQLLQRGVFLNDVPYAHTVAVRWRYDARVDVEEAGTARRLASLLWASTDQPTRRGGAGGSAEGGDVDRSFVLDLLRAGKRLWVYLEGIGERSKPADRITEQVDRLKEDVERRLPKHDGVLEVFWRKVAPGAQKDDFRDLWLFFPADPLVASAGSRAYEVLPNERLRQLLSGEAFSDEVRLRWSEKLNTVRPNQLNKIREDLGIVAEGGGFSLKMKNWTRLADISSRRSEQG